MHEIIAVNKKNEEISKLRIAALNSIKIFFLYDSLISQEMNGGASGCGKEKVFTKEQIILAKQRLNYMLEENMEDINFRVKREQTSKVGVYAENIKDIIGEDADFNDCITEDNKEEIKISLIRFYNAILEDQGFISIIRFN